MRLTKPFVKNIRRILKSRSITVLEESMLYSNVGSCVVVELARHPNWSDDIILKAAEQALNRNFLRI